jgi:hypothetical protein
MPRGFKVFLPAGIRFPDRHGNPEPMLSWDSVASLERSTSAGDPASRNRPSCAFCIPSRGDRLPGASGLYRTDE